MAIDYTSRHHQFEGCFNFRDIGGYQGADGREVRWGQYFRAGRQDRMTSTDLKRARALGVTTQIDLRRPEEIIDQGRGPERKQIEDRDQKGACPETRQPRPEAAQ